MSYQGQRGARQGRGFRGEGRGDDMGYGAPPRGNREDRAPLVWQTERIFQSGRITLVLQYAELENGSRRRSFRIGKESVDQPDKPFPFMDPRDGADALAVVEQMVDHVSAARVSGLAD